MYVFKGRDWTELPEALGIEVLERDLDVPLSEYWEYEEQIAQRTIDLLVSGMGNTHSMKKYHREIVRGFIEALALSDGVGEEMFIYEGMLKMSSDITLLQWLRRNLRSMWV